MVLHASVINERGQFVPGLQQDGFHVYEDKVEQKISVFRQEDVPVSMGLVIDNSGSMRESRPAVNAAALTLVKSRAGEFGKGFPGLLLAKEDVTEKEMRIRARWLRGEKHPA